MEPVTRAHADEPAPSATDISDRYSEYAKAAHSTASRCRSKGDSYGEQLASTRAKVYEEAASIAASMPVQRAAEEMMRRAASEHVRTPPLIGFDEAGLRYITARAWQFCALEIDPRLQTRAPKWD